MGIKYSVNESFFDEWSPAMAFVLGFIYADGHLEDASYIRGKYLRFTTTDRSIIDNIRSWMKSEHRVIAVPPPSPHQKISYRLRIGSHALYETLASYGLTPRKSLIVKFPDVPPRYLADFVRGYFDGDGCVFLEKGKGKQQQPIIKRLLVSFTSGSKTFLDDLAMRLEKQCGITARKAYTTNRSFQLRYSTRDALKIFKLLYHDAKPNTFLSRKFEIFQQYFILRPQQIDKEIQQVLDRHMAMW